MHRQPQSALQVTMQWDCGQPRTRAPGAGLNDLAAYGPGAPAFIWMHGATDVDYLYGFPPLPGDRRIKVATEQYETRATADHQSRRRSGGAIGYVCRIWVRPPRGGRRHLPTARGAQAAHLVVPTHMETQSITAVRACWTPPCGDPTHLSSLVCAGTVQCRLAVHKRQGSPMGDTALGPNSSE